MGIVINLVCLLSSLTTTLSLMFRFRKAPESVGLLVMTQGVHAPLFISHTLTPAAVFAMKVISGFGSGVVLQVSQVASQIVVEKKHLASVTSVVLLFSYLGNATGQSIAGGMWASKHRDH
jgi:hypothetical protein